MSIFEIATQFPELAPVTASYLGEGYDSAALLVNESWVFRFPKTAEVEAQLSMESALLPLIAPLLPIDVPRFRFMGRPGEHFPRHFVGYPKLPGVPAIGLEPADLSPGECARVGQFFAALHGVPPADASACGVTRADLQLTIFDIRDDAVSSLEQVEPVAPDAPLDAWRGYLERPPAVPPTPPVLAHNDFAAEHLLVDPVSRRVTGVIDWTDAVLTSPEVDFAGLFHWGGEAFAREVLAAYEHERGRVSDQALRVARYIGACRGAMDVAFGIEMQRREYVTAGLRALRLCATL